MKSINNIKKLATLVAGVAIFGSAMAFASPVTIGSVPIINTAGQPVVQVVLGSHSQPSDGIAAGNIAAAIGNLAYTSTPVTATVNSGSLSGLKVSYSNPQYSISSQQVWLNESGVTSATGASYIFSTLIGSVLNQGVQLGSQASTKGLQASGSYSFPESYQTTTSPASSPYTGVGSVPISQSVTTGNGGGVTFPSFSNGANDNLLQITSSQFSPLLTNWGSNGESESLFLTGFPVYDQQSGTNNFALMDAGGAYQVIFNKPINNRSSSNSNVININVPIRLLGTNYTIINGTGAGSNLGASSIYKVGGTIYLASSVSPMSTVYVGKNLSSGPWTVQVQDLAETQSGTNDAASLGVYYNGTLTNESSISAGTTTKFNVSGHTLFINLNSTFAGLYAYQKWAKIQLYTSVYKVTSNQAFNKTYDPGWNAELLWTNTSSSTGLINQLYGIDLYNVSSTTLLPGQSFSFIQNPSVYKLTFEGSTTPNYDAVTAQLSTASQVNYADSTSGSGTLITNITEPAQLLTLTSQIPNAFSYAGQESSTALYDLTPYSMSIQGNALSLGSSGGSNVTLSYTDPTTVPGANTTWISQSQPISVSVIGYSQSSKTYTQESVSFSDNKTGATSNVLSTIALPTALYNVSAIKIQGNRALPIFGNTINQGSLSIKIATETDPLATLSSSSTPLLLYSQTGQSYYGTSVSSASINYNQQNGQPISTVILTPAPSTSVGIGPHQLFSFRVGEDSVPANTLAQDFLGVGIYNNTASATPTYVLNYSASGQHNNVTYTSTQNDLVSVQPGFRTEKGSKVVSISPSVDTFDMATSVAQLQFAVTPSSGTSNSMGTKFSTSYGPYSIGEQTNLPNVTIGKINASISYTNSSITPTITGQSNITATPSISTATTPTLLTNLPTNPIVVLDSNANPSSSLILIGSGYVNTLSQALQQQYNVSINANTPTITGTVYGNKILIAGYTAQQTEAAANSFIAQLYAAAASNT